MLLECDDLPELEPVRDRPEALPADLVFLHLLKDASGCTHLRPLGDGRWAGVCRYMFTWGVLIGRMGDLHTYDERYCYETLDKAVASLDAWNGAGEPQGWHRHVGTGRRRPEGDAAQEYVRF